MTSEEVADLLSIEKVPCPFCAIHISSLHEAMVHLSTHAEEARKKTPPPPPTPPNKDLANVLDNFDMD